MIFTDFNTLILLYVSEIIKAGINWIIRVKYKHLGGFEMIPWKRWFDERGWTKQEIIGSFTIFLFIGSACYVIYPKMMFFLTGISVMNTIYDYLVKKYKFEGKI